MARRTDPYTWDDIEFFIRKVNRQLAGRYTRFGVTADDIRQECWTWALANRERIERWLAASPQQTTRIYRSLSDQAVSFGEGEKAARLGYSPDDLYWYTPGLITSLLPFALDPEWEGFVDGELNDQLLTLVVDVRKAIESLNVLSVFMQANEGDDVFEVAVHRVVDFLGGNRPFVGRRRSVSNAKAQSEGTAIVTGSWP